MTISHVIYMEFARLIVSRQWVTEVVTTIVLWEFSSNKEGACPKREIDTDIIIFV